MSDFVNQMKEAVEHIRQAQAIFARGPLDYYLQKLVEHSEALLTKFSPLKVGQEARIVGNIKCDGGWQGAEKTLAIGNVGIVQNVDYIDGRFVCEFVPHRQWYKCPISREYHEKEYKHSYTLRQEILEALEDSQ